MPVSPMRSQNLPPGIVWPFRGQMI
jgi:hypothetical protein